MKTPLLILMLAASCSISLAQSTTAPAPVQPKPTEPATTKTPPATSTAPAATTPAAPTEQAKLQYAEFKTSAGTFVLELNYEKAPISTVNFMKYVDKGFYDGTVFHRVIPDFMIQGGGFDASGAQKTTDAPIQNEHSNGLKNVRGSISMARTNDPNSGTSQFFINVANNDGTLKYNLDMGPGYAVFGKVVSGMEVVDAIKNAPTIKDGRENSRPEKPVIVEKATRLNAQDAAKYTDKSDAKK